MYFQDLPSEKQAMLLVGLTLDEDSFLSKLENLKSKYKKPIEDLIHHYQSLSLEEKKRFLTQGFRQLKAERRPRFFQEVHPDWIFEKIKNEPPVLFSALLRFLPSDYVEYFLKKLPTEYAAVLPKLKDTFQVDTDLIEHLRLKLVSLFDLGQTMSVSGLRVSLPEWPLGKIHAFFKELGFKELAMAFSTLPQKVSKVVLSRMTAADSEEVSKRIEKGSSVSESRIKKAQGHILALDLTGGASRQLVLETGFYMFSRTLLAPLGPYFLAIERKFPLESASVLRKCAEKNIQINFAETIEPYVEELEENLAQFERAWKQFKSGQTLKNKKEG